MFLHSNFNSDLISGFPENATLSNGVFVVSKSSRAAASSQGCCSRTLRHDSNISSVAKSFQHAGELYCAKRANLGVQTFAILMFKRMNSDLI